jgi:hypothetical protein
MAKKLGKVVRGLGLPLVGLTVSVGAISVGAIYFNFGSPNENTKQPSQVLQPGNITTVVSDSGTAINSTTHGDGSPVKVEAPNSNIVGRDDKRNINNVGETQINTRNYTENVNGRQINTETYNDICSQATIDRGSSCLNNGSVTNNF